MSEMKGLILMRSISMFSNSFMCFRIEADGRRNTYFVVFGAMAFTILIIVTCFMLTQHREGMKSSFCHTFLLMRMEEFLHEIIMHIFSNNNASSMGLAYVMVVVHFFLEFTQEHSTHI